MKDAHCITYLGVSGDKWWDHDQLLMQVNQAIEIFEEAHPNCIVLFLFDHSSAHASLRQDALHAFNINKTNGGKMRKMKDTVIPMNNPTVECCYRLSKRPNCFRGTCSGLGTWQPRCTSGALSGTGRDVRTPFLSLITHVTVLMSGAASPMGPASYTTRASVRVPVPFPQLSRLVPSYRPITPNPCALGQQVTVLLSRLIVLPGLVYFYLDHS